MRLQWEVEGGRRTVYDGEGDLIMRHACQNSSDESEQRTFTRWAVPAPTFQLPTQWPAQWTRELAARVSAPQNVCQAGKGVYVRVCPILEGQRDHESAFDLRRCSTQRVHVVCKIMHTSSQGQLCRTTVHSTYYITLYYSVAV